MNSGVNICNQAGTRKMEAIALRASMTINSIAASAWNFRSDTNTHIMTPQINVNAVNPIALPVVASAILIDSLRLSPSWYSERTGRHSRSELRC